MKVSFEEIGRLAVTFAAEDCKAGQVCKVSGNGAVVPCTAGERFCGVVEGVRGGYAAVQIGGFACVAWTGAAPALGYVNLSADGNGGVQAGSGREYLVVSVDEIAKTAVIKL